MRQAHADASSRPWVNPEAQREQRRGGFVGPCVSLGQLTFLSSAYTAVACHTGVGAPGDPFRYSGGSCLSHTPSNCRSGAGIADLRVD